MRTMFPPFTLRLLPCLALALGCLHLRAEDAVLPPLVPEDEARNAIAAGLASLQNETKERQEPGVVRAIADIQRTSHLDKDRLKMLEVAGQGLLQEMASAHDQELRAQADQRVRGVPPKLVAKVLAGISASNFYFEPALKLPAWRKMLKALLTAEELKKWDKVVADRTAYRARAITEMLLLEQRQLLDLSNDQMTKLEPLLQKAVNDFLPDAIGMFSGGSEDDQGLYTGLVKVLIMGIPEDKMHEIIKPDKWRDWQSSAGDYASEWNWIIQRHDQRMEEEKRP